MLYLNFHAIKQLKKLTNHSFLNITSDEWKRMFMSSLQQNLRVTFSLNHDMQNLEAYENYQYIWK